MAEPIDLTARRGYHVLLPLPPSENDMYEPVSKGRMVKSAIYVAWIEEAGHMLNRQSTVVYHEDPVEITILISPRLTKTGKQILNGDSQNFEKALYDLLTPPKGRKKHGHSLIPDDNMRWLPNRSSRVLGPNSEEKVPPGSCQLTIRPVKGETDNG